VGRLLGEVGKGTRRVVESGIGDLVGSWVRDAVLYSTGEMRGGWKRVARVEALLRLQDSRRGMEGEGER